MIELWLWAEWTRLRKGRGRGRSFNTSAYASANARGLFLPIQELPIRAVTQFPCAQFGFSEPKYPELSYVSNDDVSVHSLATFWTLTWLISLGQFCVFCDHGHAIRGLLAVKNGMCLGPLGHMNLKRVEYAVIRGLCKAISLGAHQYGEQPRNYYRMSNSRYTSDTCSSIYSPLLTYIQIFW